MNMNAFFNMSYGVYIISTWDGERPTGCTANCAMQITADPATIAISISHDNFTNQCIEQSGKFAISILGEKSDPSIIGTFGFQSGKDMNKFDSVQYDIRADMPIVSEGCAYITCEVIDKMETDTHTVFLGKALDADVLGKDNVMTYDYYHKVIKGKSSKNAPTYVEENSTVNNITEENIGEKYICSVCKYEYVGDIPFEELPDDYICPVCKKPKSFFNKQV
ncbi:MAG: flavin reductase [Lachnotalea sp.]